MRNLSKLRERLAPAGFSPLVGNHCFYDIENLLLLMARQSGDGFELAFELGLGTTLVALTSIVNAQDRFHGNAENL